MFKGFGERFSSGFMDGTEWLQEWRQGKLLLTSPFFWIAAAIATAVTFLISSPWPAVALLSLPVLEVIAIPLVLGVIFGLTDAFKGNSSLDTRRHDRELDLFKHNSDPEPALVVARYEQRTSLVKRHYEDRQLSYDKYKHIMNQKEDRWNSFRG